MEQDIDVYDLSIAATPIVFRESKKFDGSIIITASHNPFDWNGLKFIIDGRGIFEKNCVNYYQLKQCFLLCPMEFLGISYLIMKMIY